MLAILGTPLVASAQPRLEGPWYGQHGPAVIAPRVITPRIVAPIAVTAPVIEVPPAPVIGAPCNETVRVGVDRVFYPRHEGHHVFVHEGWRR